MSSSSQLAVQALNEVSKLLGKLTEQQLTDLVEGRAVVEFRTPDEVVTSRPVKKPPTRKAAPAPLDLDEVLHEISAMTEEDAVERYLKEHDKQLSTDQMRELAARIGPPVSTQGTKAVLRKNIAAGTAGLLNRPAAVFSGSWNR